MVVEAVLIAEISVVETATVDRVVWMQYRSRILARDPSVLQDFTDFGQCDNKYCYSFSGPGFAHPFILQYWKGGTSAQLIPWLPIEEFY